MKSYLSLIPISAKVRKRQNRMTVLCIIISVFLVTAIFSVADMMIRTENDDIIITDQREGNKQNSATYWAARIVCYGFLAIIGVISLFNIVNSISMSVSARIKQYGAMRAVGMDNRQLKRMISAEAYTYAISGLIVGCGIGLPLSRFLYNRLITHYFGIEWRFPILWFGIVVAFIFISAIVSVYAPAKRIRNMPITATINEL